MITSGWPSDATRTAPTIHWPVTHGPFPPGVTNGHPATTYGAAIVATGIPDTNTCGLGAVGIACPPCEHMTVAPRCRIGAGMLNHREGAEVDIDRRADQRDRSAFAVA